MEVASLRAFLAVADRRNYGRAALDLSVTQPTLTKQIQALEARVGGRLFSRGRHGATLTELGAILLPEARDLVCRADALELRMARAARGEVGRLSVGFGLSSIETAPRAVAAFRRRYPGVTVTLDDMSSHSQLERLATGELNVGFVRLPVGDAGGQVLLGTDRLAMATSGEGAADVQEFVQLRRERGPGLVGQIDRYRAAAGITAPIVQEADDLQTVLALVAAGVGAALVPSGATRIAPSSVTLTPVRHPDAEWRIGAVWNAARPNPLTSNFIEVATA
ncbi:LysR substrate-binding domain-containing protein [Spirillospora sp. CA-294931]|uniref:LysR substrate-binding domain-containing protein n=1 Tax=Spirillospora sp. CA-294931 TaxID=3240042 RepID=UPI003D8BDE0B